MFLKIYLESRLWCQIFGSLRRKSCPNPQIDGNKFTKYSPLIGGIAPKCVPGIVVTSGLS